MDALAERALAPHHVALIERARARFAADPEVVAMLVGGSVAHGFALPSSDVDVLLVLDEETARRRPERTLADTSIAGYEDGYLDVKLISPSFLADVAERGSEPARWAFKDAIVVFTHDPSLPELLERAVRYPASERDERLRIFLSYLRLHVWFMGEAEKRADRYLATYASAKVVLFAGRAVLAHNRMLYPFHKWLLRELEQAPEQPHDLPELVDRVLRDPSRRAADALAEAVGSLCGIETPGQEPAERFVELTEWAWRRGQAAPEDL